MVVMVTRGLSDGFGTHQEARDGTRGCVCSVSTGGGWPTSSESARRSRPSGDPRLGPQDAHLPSASARWTPWLEREGIWLGFAAQNWKFFDGERCDFCGVAAVSRTSACPTQSYSVWGQPRTRRARIQLVSGVTGCSISPPRTDAKQDRGTTGEFSSSRCPPGAPRAICAGK